MLKDKLARDAKWGRKSMCSTRRDKQTCYEIKEGVLGGQI